ncbi:KIR-like protein [Plasmodium coatneyi]|uniref:KIR-like protein n=1 Tax=Plasmodium coatneyi TaxID=208452 RepID=A0A1B1E5X7_9APIC|nr:KIR-like protein [Plasmodium coatneyi]ANQ10388.1 KIR-like protein [Plasmodium coatneyi]
MSGSEDLLKSLPSWTHYYEKFEKSPPGCTDTNKCNTERDSYGLLNRGLGNEHVQAGNTLAYIYETYGGGQHRKPAECEALHFFFYWLGDKLPESAKNVAFQAMISTICSAINSPSEKQACGIPRDDQSVDKDLFLHRKIIFDFWYDHPTIQVLLENSGSEGLEKCEKYIQRVKAAHSAVAINCATETTRSYCTTFWKDHQEKINLALAQLQSKFDSAQQRIQRKAITASNQLNDAIHQANKASSLSSAFGTLAALELPALAYFLYKVKNYNYSSEI